MGSRLTGSNSYTRVGTNLSLLTGIERQYQAFILACRVDLLPKSVKVYTYQVGRFIRYCMENEIIDAGVVKVENVRMFYIRMQETNNPTSIRNYHRHINRFFNWLVMEGFIEKTPMINLKPPRKEHKILVPFTIQDIKNMLYVCSGPRIIDARNRAIILLFLDTGIRLSEMADMKWEDIEVGGELIKIHGKGAKERVIRMGKKAQKALYKYLNMLVAKGIQSHNVWLTEEFKPLQSQGLQAMVKVICSRAGITGKKRGPHTFRHTFAMHFLRNGGDVFSLQIILGHSKLETVKIYLSMLNSESAIEVHRNASPVDKMSL